MAQRRTASGSFTFHNVLVTPDEILGPPPSPEGAFATFLFVVNQLVKTYVYLGIAEGAFQVAKDYTTSATRPWITSGVDRASKDPFIMHHYGELWMQLKAAISLAEQAAQQVQAAWDKGQALTHEERGEVAPQRADFRSRQARMNACRVGRESGATKERSRLIPAILTGLAGQCPPYS